MIQKFILGILFSSVLMACGQHKLGSETIDATSFKERMEKTTEKIILDVRTPEEFKEGALAGANNLNIYDADFEQKVNQLDHSKTIFVYCKAGGRSSNAVSILSKNGFKSIVELKGGLMAWNNQNLPLANANPIASKDLFTKANLDKIVAENKYVIVDYYADWCAPCMRMKPILEKLGKTYSSKVKILRINVDQAKELAKSQQIEALPVIVKYENGLQTKVIKKELNETEFIELIQ